MTTLSQQALKHFRIVTFHNAPGRRISSPQEALEFVNERGFTFFWPVQGIDLPSLWVAAAGDRPVPNDHDDPGHKTWGWKDDSLDKKVWYYAKILRHRATFVSLDIIPFFYALSTNYGNPEEDYQLEYEEGKLTVESKQIFEALLKQGPLDTISLRKAARLSNPTTSTRFNKALDDLQAELKVMPVGVADVGAWGYAYVYDLTHRHYPWLIEKSGSIKESQARQKLIEVYFRSVGISNPASLSKLFHWRPLDIDRSLQSLKASGVLQDGIKVEGKQDEMWVLKHLLK